MQNESKRKSFRRNQITNALCFLTIKNKTRSSVLGPHYAWWFQRRPCSPGAWPGLYSVGPCPQGWTPFLACLDAGPGVCPLRFLCLWGTLQPLPWFWGFGWVTPKRAMSLYVMFYFEILHYQCFL